MRPQKKKSKLNTEQSEAKFSFIFKIAIFMPRENSCSAEKTTIGNYEVHLKSQTERLGCVLFVGQLCDRLVNQYQSFKVHSHN